MTLRMTRHAFYQSIHDRDFLDVMAPCIFRNNIYITLQHVSLYSPVSLQGTCKWYTPLPHLLEAEWAARKANSPVYTSKYLQTRVIWNYTIYCVIWILNALKFQKVSRGEEEKE